MGHQTSLLHTSKPKERKFKSITKENSTLQIKKKRGIISKGHKKFLESLKVSKLIISIYHKRLIKKKNPHIF